MANHRLHRQRGLDHVHAALQEKRILSVKLAWAKYMVCWSRSGPGFYAGINISLNGEYSVVCTTMCGCTVEPP